MRPVPPVWSPRCSKAMAVAGLIFAALFLPRGIVRVDPLVGHSPLTVRLLLAPGVVALWPAMALLWRRAVARPFRRPARAGHTVACAGATATWTTLVAAGVLLAALLVARRPLPDARVEALPAPLERQGARP